MKNVECVRIDTNGCWNPKAYPDVNWSKIFLNFSFHPSMISLEKFIVLLRKKLEHGINIGMVNFVMAPSQINDYLEIYTALKEIGIFLNC